MWTTVTYQPTGLFSLRPANTTTGGAKTLLTPTPFAIKMALIDAAIRTFGLEACREWFADLRDLQIAILLPEHLSVVSMFSRVRRPIEIKDAKSGDKKIAKKKEDKLWPWDSTITFREFVQYPESFQLAFQTDENIPIPQLASQINYLGKRGSFVQYYNYGKLDVLTKDFTSLNPTDQRPFLPSGSMQLLDDFGSSISFEQVNIYSESRVSKIELNKDSGRVFRSIVLPYEVLWSGRGYTVYQRIA